MFERGLDATFDAAQHSPRHQRRNRPGELDFHQVATATYPRDGAHQQPATSGRSRGERQHLVETRHEALGKHVVVGNRAGVHVDA
jgi:hypothetical protein